MFSVLCVLLLCPLLILRTVGEGSEGRRGGRSYPADERRVCYDERQRVGEGRSLRCGHRRSDSRREGGVSVRAASALKRGFNSRHIIETVVYTC